MKDRLESSLAPARATELAGIDVGLEPLERLRAQRDDAVPFQ